MATAKPPTENTDKEGASISAVSDPDIPVASDGDEDWDDIKDFDWGSNEGKPTTGKALYEALLESGMIGAWKDRTDIGDTLEYARELRRRANTRHRD